MSLPPDRASKRTTRVLTASALIAVFVAVLLVVANGYATHRMESTRSAWDQTLGPWEQLLERFPRTEANPSAIELERLAAALGIDIVPRYVGKDRSDGEPANGRDRPTPERVERFSTVKREVFGNYMSKRIARARGGAIEAPPEALTTYMVEHDEELLALRTHLLNSPAPRWSSDLSRRASAPIPNLLGQLNIHKLLANVALARAQAGDLQGALADVEASWKLTHSIRDSPILINQLIVIAATRIHAGTLRQLSSVPTAWIARLEEHDYRASFLTAMMLTGRVWLEYGSGDLLADDATRWARATAVVMRPYNRICLAGVSGDWRDRIENLRRVGALCDYDLAAQQATLDFPIPSWNKIGKMIVPNLTDAVDRVARLELDLELTRLVIEAEASRHGDAASWASLAGTRTSESCPDGGWIYTASEGGLEIAFSREISWPEQMGVVLPTRWRSE